jgi:hypothetical protein
VLNAGSSVGDGYYAISLGVDRTVIEKEYCDMNLNGGGYTRCLLVTNNAGEDLTNNTWFDRCVDYSMRWSQGELLMVLHDSRATTVYTAYGKRNGTWTYNTLTSTASPSEQESLSLHVPIQLSTGDQLWITGRTANNQGCAGALGNGYGILISPESMQSASDLELRMMVMPYRLQVGSNEPRQFGFDNLQWSPGNEISYGEMMAPFSSCEAPPPFLGWFEFYVR